LLGLPAQIAVSAIIGIGHPGEKRKPLPASKLQHEKVWHNGYSAPWERP
jgi:hypothetical protein